MEWDFGDQKMLSRCVILISYLGLSLSTVSQWNKLRLKRIQFPFKLQIAVLTSAVSIYNLDDYIWKTYEVKSEEAFLHLKTG